eukprot:m.71286 g.71286  ORF g.71286 m.71286 type:complete len:792 (+) comp12936_c0_seq4:70-2445(+)
MAVSGRSLIGAVGLLGVSFLIVWVLHEPELPTNLEFEGESVALSRTPLGVMKIEGRGNNAFAYGLGYSHAFDRLVQMVLMRAAAQGRLVELFPSTDDTVLLDITLRAKDFRRRASVILSQLNTTTISFLEAYCKGVNDYMAQHTRPVELLITAVQPEPWTPEDCVVVGFVMGYLGLSSMQSDLEKFLLQVVRAGAPLEGPLSEIFSLDGATLEQDTELLDVLRNKVQLHHSPLPSFVNIIPTLTASNNWAIHATHTASGGALQCNDPHLILSQLPAAFYELVHVDRADRPDPVAVGISVPGIPSLVMGRTNLVSFGMTYGMMDQMDYYVEHVVDMRVRRPDGFTEEIVVRKEELIGTRHTNYYFFHTSHGRIEVPAKALFTGQLADGFYLAVRWSWDYFGREHAETLFRRPREHNVEQMAKVLQHVALSANWIMADHEGNIALQQTGLRPARPHALTLLPLLGWRANISWTGLASPSDLYFEMNPARGFLATANNQHTEHALGAHTINVDIGNYRVARISSLLSTSIEAKKKLTVADMQRMQTDTYSIQAERFMAVLRPLLQSIAHCPKCGQLAAWDHRYDGTSRGALLFTLFYNELVARVMAPLMGAEAWAQVRAGGSVFYCIMQRIDELILADGSSLRRLTGNVSVTDLFLSTAKQVLLPGQTSAQSQHYDTDSKATYSAYQSITYTNLFYQGRLGALGALFGIDHGPHPHAGSHATIVQGAQGVNFGMLVNVGPVWRFIADLRETGAWSVLAGGASGRPGSPWYASELELYRTGKYKYLPSDNQKQSA